MNVERISVENLKNLNFEKIRGILLDLPKWFLVLWISINIIIPGYGILLYYWQYRHYNPIFWIFIPDSSTFAILFGVFLIVTLGFKKNVQVLNLITFIGLIKVFCAYILIFTVQPTFFDLVSLSAHTFELVEGILLLPFIRVDFKNFQVGFLITVIDWFLDLFNPFGLPTLSLYPLDEINPNNMAPFIDSFVIVFTLCLIFLFTYIRLKHWVKDNESVKWVEDVT